MQWGALTIALCIGWALSSPSPDQNVQFYRGAVESSQRQEQSSSSSFSSSSTKVEEYGSKSLPIRTSVESVPLKSLRELEEQRVPLRDAVESSPDAETIAKLRTASLKMEPESSTEEQQSESNYKQYYGAASHLNVNKKNDKLQQGNMNLNEMRQTASGAAERRLVVCYVQGWAAYRSPPLAFTAGLVPHACTHLHYAFATLHPDTYTLTPTDDDYDVVKGGYRSVTGLRHSRPGLRVLLSVGGEGSERLLASMAADSIRRTAFVDSAVAFLKEHGFDGLDLHWAYPGESEPHDKDHLTALLYELREKFTPHDFTLSIILPSSRYLIEDGYELTAVSGAADYAVLQAWDMHAENRNSVPRRAVHHSPLQRDPAASETRESRFENVEFAVKYLLKHGMVKEKLVLGVPIFGRSFTLTNSVITKPGAFVSGWGAEGKYTQNKGLLAYFEICMALREGRGDVNTDSAGNAYAVFGDQWVGFDNVKSIAEKMRFAARQGLAGGAAWAIDMDDFRGLCGEKFPLLTALAQAINDQPVRVNESQLKEVSYCERDSSYLSSEAHSCAVYKLCSGGISYPIVCDDATLYDPTTGHCGHLDATRCVPGQKLRISLDDAARHLMSEEHLLESQQLQTGDNEPKRVEASKYQTVKAKANDKLVVCYMTNWAFYRRGEGKFVPEHIDTRLCTHVVYAYATLTPDTLLAKEFDPWTDIDNNMYERVTSLNDVKVLLGLGGWTDSAGEKYSKLVSSGAARKNFITHLIAFLRQHHFAGLHLDWNYPVCWQSNCKEGADSDKTNFAKLIQELSSELHSAGMELGVAVSGYKEIIERAYDLRALSSAADFLSAMTYDYHGGWERTVSHATPLTSRPGDLLPEYTVEYAIKALISGGANPKKLLLGLAFYGETYRLEDVEGPATPGTPASGPGEPGEFSKQPGMLAYYEICHRIKNLRWQSDRQPGAGPYAYSRDQWVGFDDQQSIKEKVEWGVRQGLGGVTAWTVDLDDFSNSCCAEPSPLLRAANRALGRSTPAPPTSACARPPTPVTPAPPTTTTVDDLGGAHNHGSHGSSSTTWPSWIPGVSSPATSTATAQTWWPTTASTTTARTPAPTKTTSAPTTTTSSTTTTPKPTTAQASIPTNANDGVMEGDSCSTDYDAAANDCNSYLQCISGKWRKHRCAPGLHWSTKGKRCDWPSSAKCTQHQVPSTLSPVTARPPAPRPTSTTTAATTTTRAPTTTTTTTKAPTTTSTTRAPNTSASAGQPSPASDGVMEGDSCSTDYDAAANDCNSYLQCISGKWRKHRCAPGLHWSTKGKRCDWPSSAKCTQHQVPSTLSPVTARPPAPRPTSTTTAATTTTRAPTTTTTTTKAPTTTSTTRAPNTSASAGQSSPASEVSLEGSSCDGFAGEYRAAAGECNSYLQCAAGSWRKHRCAPSLHWNAMSSRCDWPRAAKCSGANMDTSSPAPASTTTSTTTQPPPREDDSADLKPGMACETGSYQAHPSCTKFFVCVNGALVAQGCAPGLAWNRKRGLCDFPAQAGCVEKKASVPAKDQAPAANKPVSLFDTESSAALMEAPMELTACNDGTYTGYPGDCSRYRHCLWGKYKEFRCSAGLHWNQQRQICDWPKAALCENGGTSSGESSYEVNAPTTTVVEPAPTWEKPAPTVEPSTEKPSTTTVTIIDKPDIVNSPYKLVCYYTNWAWYRPGLGKYVPEDIDPTLCTHIVYGFAVLGYEGTITAHDSWADYDNKFYERVVAYKKHGIKVSLALGGWNDSAGDKYSKLVNSPSARVKFVRHAVQFLEKYGFDGLDLDWEYPKCWQVDCSKGPDSDKEGFSALVRELAEAFRPKGFLLSSAVSPNKKVIDAGYDVPVMAQNMDWIAVMTYDYHGQWDKKTGHVAPLYYHPEDDTTYFNANYTMHYWMEKGAPASKLVMGMPLYGQSFTLGTQWDTPPELLAKKNETGLNVPARSGGEAGEFTRAKGFLAYYEICERLKNRAWTVKRDPEGRMGPYAFRGDQWVSFDDVDTIRKKTKFIRSLNLAGGMVWALDLDDFRNRCGEGKHPLLTTIRNGLLEVSSKEELIASAALQELPHKPSVEEVSKPVVVSKPEVSSQKPNYHPTITESSEISSGTSSTIKPPSELSNNLDMSSDSSEYKVVCYFTNWAWYRPGPGKYTPADIDPTLCTHIVYAFAVLDRDRLIIKPHDSWADIDNKFYEKVVALKSRGVKVVLGLGGWNDSAGDKYSRLVNSPASRRTFLVHALDFIEQYNFDGLDLDWEYPKCWQVDCNKGPESDKAGFAELVKELRAAFTPKGLLLSAAVSPSKRVIDNGYDVPVLSENLDWIAVMTYDYHGQWDKKTGHVAPMYVRDSDTDKTFNTNFTINYWISEGASPRKIVMGLPMYGQSFSLAEGGDKGLDSATYGGGEAGDETRARGFLAFYEICERIRVRGWNVVRDPSGCMGPYATKGDQWVSFDDDFMIHHKSEYIRAMGLGGGMVWALDLDDFNGKFCGCDKSPLLSTVNSVLRGREAPPPCALDDVPAPVVVTQKPAQISQTPTPEPSGSTELIQGNEVTPDGGSCSGNSFKPDSTNCGKYYLCNNGKYTQLSCPPPLHWNQDHCDWPSKAKCTNNKAHTRIASDNEPNESMVVCYFTNWAYYRNGNGSYSPQDVDASLCTHIVYAWAKLDPETFAITPRDQNVDIDNDFYGKMTALRLKGVKVLVGVGGWEDSAGNKWSRMANDPDKREGFVNSVIEFIQRWHFDGVELSWQYPVCWQSSCAEAKDHAQDRDGFSALMLDLATVFRPRGLLLAAGVAASPSVATVAYHVSDIAAAADWLTVAAYDYHGAWEQRTAHAAPITPETSDDTDNIKSSLSYWLESGLPADKLVLGLPFYGQTYTLREASTSGIGALAIGPGKAGPLTGVPGFVAYHEICANIQSTSWRATHTPQGSYAASGVHWVSYMDEADVTRAVGAAVSRGLRGIAAWALDLDDWRGSCGCEMHPLLRAARRALLDPAAPPSACLIR